MIQIKPYDPHFNDMYKKLLATFWPNLFDKRVRAADAHVQRKEGTFVAGISPVSRSLRPKDVSLLSVSHNVTHGHHATPQFLQPCRVSQLRRRQGGTAVVTNPN